MPLTRIDVIKALGGKCLVCGITDIRILQIDHRWGNGHQEGLVMEPNTQRFYRHVLKYKQRFQILCCNHNWLKGVLEDECKRKPRNRRLVERYTVFLTP